MRPPDAPARPTDDIRGLAAQLVRDEPGPQGAQTFGPLVRQRIGGGPSLLIGDQSQIPLKDVWPPSPLEHRMALLARPGDRVAVRQRDPGFDPYLSEGLGLTDLQVIEIPWRARGSVPSAICDTADLLDRCVALAQGGGQGAG